jgi:lipoprotein-anchoring transpeptidase ErfK/SrfK
MPWRIRPLALVVGAVVVIALVILLVNVIGSPSTPSSGSGSRGAAASGSGSGGAAASGSGSSGSASGGGLSVSTFPASGAQNVPTNTVITVSFSQPVTLGKTPTPVLSPDIGGKWVQSGPKKFSYQLHSPLIPDTRMQVTIPGGHSGIQGAQGATLPRSATVTFGVAAGDTLRLQQLLAQLDYLPLSFAPSGPAPSVADIALDQAGTFNWRWTGLPSELTSQWTQGTSNEITRAAIETFENQNGLGVDGIAGPAVWTSLINDARNGQASTTAYVYVLVNKVEPENLTLWEDGDAKYVGIPVNTGAPGADTTNGTFAVFEHVRYSDMKGTNIDGSTYNDPNVPYASYFNGGDALHGFIRSSYGSPQSNGCVEMPYSDAALVWPLTPIGTLVTVEGPNYGSAPPSTTTTTAPATASTTTTAPAATTTAPPAATTTTAPAAPPSTGNSGG